MNVITIAAPRTKGTGILAIYKLMTKYLLRSVLGPFLAFFLPVILHVILGFLIDSANVFGGIATNVGLIVGFFVLPNVVIQLKGSTTMKMIGASPVRSWVFSLAVVSYFLVLLIAATAWLCAWSLIVFGGPGKIIGLGTAAGFWAFVFGVLVNGILCMGVGCLIVNFSRSALGAQIIGLSIYFPISFLTGQFIPPSIYVESGAIYWIGRLMPFHYASMWNMQAVNGDILVAAFDGKTGLFELNAAGNAVMMTKVADSNAFAYTDYFSSDEIFEEVAKKAAGYNQSLALIANGPDGAAGAAAYKYNTFGGQPVSMHVIFRDFEHAITYAYQVFVLILLAPAVWLTFRWK